MIPDKTYKIEPVTVWRLVDDAGNEVYTEDDHGSYSLHFCCYEDAAEEARERRQLRKHGPLTKEDQERADSTARMMQTVHAYYRGVMLENLHKTHAFAK